MIAWAGAEAQSRCSTYALYAKVPACEDGKDATAAI
jgi:hypothetical protein